MTDLSFFRHSVEFAFSIILPDPLSALANKAIQSSTTMTQLQLQSIHPQCQESELKCFPALEEHHFRKTYSSDHQNSGYYLATKERKIVRVYGFSGVGDLHVCVNVIAMHKSFFIVENGSLRHWCTGGPTCYYMVITVRS